MNAVGWCFVEASISSVIKNSFRTPRCTDKSGQEDCDECTKLKIRPEKRDAWTKVFKRVVIRRHTKACNWVLVDGGL